MPLKEEYRKMVQTVKNVSADKQSEYKRMVRNIKNPEAYVQEVRNNAVSHIYSKFNDSINTFDEDVKVINGNAPLWGKSALNTKKAGDLRLTDIETLKKEIGTFKQYFSNPSDADTMLKSLEEVSNGYNTVIEQAVMRSWFETEEEYNTALEQSETARKRTEEFKKQYEVWKAEAQADPEYDYYVNRANNHYMLYGVGENDDTKYLTEEQAELYKYYYGKELEQLYGKLKDDNVVWVDKRHDYYDSIQQDVTDRAAADRFSKIEGNKLQEVLFGIKAGLDQFSTGVENLGDMLSGKEYIAPSSTQKVGAMVRNSLLSENGKSTVGSIAYDLLSTSANMVPSILVSSVVGVFNPIAGSVTGSALLGSSATGNAYAEMVNLGYDKKQAATYATLVGISEGALQYLLGGVNKLGGLAKQKIGKDIAIEFFEGTLKASAQFAINFGAEIISEGFEEALQEILDPIFKNLAFDENYNKVDWEQVGYSAFLGSLSAGLMNGSIATTEAVANIIDSKLAYNTDLKALGKSVLETDNVEVLIDVVDSLTDNKQKRKLEAAADNISKITKENATDTDYKKIGKFYVDIQKAELQSIKDFAKTTVDPLIKEQLQASGIKDIKKGTQIIRKAMRDELTDSETAYFNEMGGQQIVDNVLASLQEQVDSGNENIDISVNKIYNSNRGESYARTDEFRSLQAEVQGMAAATRLQGQLDIGENEDILRRLSRVFKEQLEFWGSSSSVRNGLLNLVDSRTGNQFNIYQNVDGELFHDVFEIARSYLQNGELVDLHSVETTEDRIGYDDCINYLSEDGLSGFSITPEGDLISVFNASEKRGFLRAISEIVSEKAKTLDCYASQKQNLMEMYEKCFGFKTASLMDYNMEYDHDNIAQNHNKPQIAFMVNTEADVDTRHFGENEYEEAKAYQQSFVNKAGSNGSASSVSESDYVPESKSRKESRLDDDIKLRGVYDENGRLDINELLKYSMPTELTDSQLNENQKRAKELGAAHGIKVRILNTEKEFGYFSEGFITEDGKTIVIDINDRNPTLTVMTHELAHYGEDTDGHKLYSAASRKSKGYGNWVRKRFESLKNNKNSEAQRLYNEYNEKYSGAKGDNEVILKEAVLREWEQYKIDEANKKGANSKSGPEHVQNELIARFTAEYLFSEKYGGIDAITEGMTKSHKNAVVRWLSDFFAFIKSKLQGNNRVTFEITRLQNRFNEMLSERDATKGTIAENGGVRFSFMDDTSFEDNINQIINMDDAEAKARQEKGQYLRVLKQTPNIILENVQDAKNIEVIMRFDAAYLAARHSGILDGNYHNYGKDFAKKLINVLNNPDAIVRLDNGRLNLFGSIEHNKGNISLVSVEMNTVKDINSQNKAYNLVVSMLPAKENYINNLINKRVTKLEYEKEELSQVNPQLHKSLSTINDNSSNNRVSQNTSVVNNIDMQNGENNSQNSYSISDDIDEAPTPTIDDLLELYHNGTISNEVFKTELQRIYGKKKEQYGTIKRGEMASGNESFDRPVPKQVSEDRLTRRFVRTVTESDTLTPEMAEDLEIAVLKDALSYVPISNEAGQKAAQRIIETGDAERVWQEVVSGGRSPSKENITLGEMMLRLAAERRDNAAVMRLVGEISEVGTRAGQTVQALSMLKRLNGLGQLYYIKKVVNSLNRELQKQKGKNAPIIQIDETLAGQLADCKTEGDFEAVYDSLIQSIANQVPPTFLDKWNAWRYMAMLFNPTTHIRNIAGNAVFVPVVRLKGALAVGLEHILVKDEEKRTKSLVIKKEYQNFAAKDFETQKEIVAGNGKYNPKNDILQNRRIFEHNILEKPREFNFKLLEKEDMLFLRLHYTHAMAGFLQARGVNVNGEVDATILKEARNYAINEAQKATYRDASKVANVINQIANANAATKIVVEGVLPFKKTPVNIMKRGIEYSPIGLLNALGKGLKQVYNIKKQNGKTSITMTEFIDGLASGMTGTGIMLLGMLLARLGLLTTGFGDDDEDYFRKLLGEQEYAIQIGDYSYTIDWMAPACIPFFIGATLQESFTDNENESFWSGASDALLSSLDPIINLSMLQGIQDTLSTVKYAASGELPTAAFNVAVSYFTQALPTLTGKIANVIDDTRRTNYIDKTSPLPVEMQKILNKALAKIPFASTLRPEYVNANGETERTGGFIGRFIQQFLSPGYFSTIEATETSDELRRLYKETGEKSVFPDTADKSISFKDVKKNLTADEYNVYATTKGKLSAAYVAEFVQSSEYKNLTDSERVEIISDIYAFANAKAKANVIYDNSDYFLKDYKKLIAALDKGISVHEWFIGKSATSTANADKDGSGGVTKKEKKEAIDNTDLPEEIKKALLEILNKK